jgi:hypothetical protein
MPYDILSDNLMNDDTPSRGRRPKVKSNNNKNNNDGFKFKPFYLHLAVIVILLGTLFFFFMSDFSFDFTDDKKGDVTISGDLIKFDQFYAGDLELYSAKFTIETETGTFDDISKNIEIQGFDGEIKFDEKNSSILITGIANKIKYGKNDIKVNGGYFELVSVKKTTFQMYFNNISLNYNKGNIKLDDTFNFEFDNTTIDFEKFNLSLTYDGSFLISGKPGSFDLNSPKQNLAISYDKEE